MKSDPVFKQRPLLQLEEYEKMQLSRKNMINQSCVSNNFTFCDDPFLDCSNLKSNNKMHNVDEVLLTKKQKIENRRIELEEMRNKTERSLIKVRVNQKRVIKSKTKKAQRDLEDLQELQTSKLVDTRVNQIKALAIQKKERNDVFNKKLKEIERLEKKYETELEEEKKKNQEEIETQRRLLFEMEEAQNIKFKMQVKELETAQRKFNEKQRKFFIGQQEQGGKKEIQIEEKFTNTGRLEDLLTEIDEKSTQEEATSSPYDLNRLFETCQVTENKTEQRDPNHEYSHDRTSTGSNDKTVLTTNIYNSNIHICGETSSITGIGGYKASDSSGFLPGCSHNNERSQHLERNILSSLT